MDALLWALRRHKGRERIASARNIAIVRVFQTTGARLSEVARMNVGDIDFRARRIAIHEAKNNQGRFIPPNDLTASCIRIWIDFRREWHDDDTEALWTDRQGKRLQPNGIGQMLRRVCEQHCIDPPLTPNTFRRGLAHHWAAMGGADDALMIIAGWHNPRMAARYRAELTAQRAFDDYDRIVGFRPIRR